MQIYLPIAEISVNVLLLLGLGAGVGFLSGMFGVGGGFLMTPLLIFIGVPPAVAVSTQANQIAATSVSGALAHWRRGAVDVRMGLYLLAGGIAGSVAGVQLFAWLKSLGQIDIAIALSYVVFLGGIGALMAFESIQALRRDRRGGQLARPRRRRPRPLAQRLPMRARFPRSHLYVSIIPPIVIGAVVGVLVAIMGVGGGFIMVPAMIYLLRMPTNVVVGTSLFQIIFVTALVTVLQATQNHTVDIILALLLILGGVIGAQIGVRAAMKVKAEALRALLAGLVLAVCLKLAWDLIATPSEMYTLIPGGL